MNANANLSSIFADYHHEMPSHPTGETPIALSGSLTQFNTKSNLCIRTYFVLSETDDGSYAMREIKDLKILDRSNEDRYEPDRISFGHPTIFETREAGLTALDEKNKEFFGHYAKSFATKTLTSIFGIKTTLIDMNNTVGLPRASYTPLISHLNDSSLEFRGSKDMPQKPLLKTTNDIPEGGISRILFRTLGIL